MASDNPAFLTQEKAELARTIEKESSTISPEEEARIRAEVREIMQKKFAVGRAKLESNPIAQNAAFEKSGTATSDTNVIDLITQSVASLQQSQPAVLLGSPISLASTSGTTGNTARFSAYFFRSSLLPPTSKFLHQCTGNQRNHRVSLGRSSEDVHTWTSLVRHYLTFMGGSDAQQVAYYHYPLAETAHEWYHGVRKKAS